MSTPKIILKTSLHLVVASWLYPIVRISNHQNIKLSCFVIKNQLLNPVEFLFLVIIFHSQKLWYGRLRLQIVRFSDFPFNFLSLWCFPLFRVRLRTISVPWDWWSDYTTNHIINSRDFVCKSAIFWRFYRGLFDGFNIELSVLNIDIININIVNIRIFLLIFLNIFFTFIRYLNIQWF